jgi:hypothetical protein
MVPTGYQFAPAVGINAAGDAFGTAQSEKGRAVVRWPAGQPDRPIVLAGPADANAYDLTDDGIVVGSIADGAAQRPYLWYPDGTGRELSLPPGVLRARAIGANGRTVIGHGELAPTDREAAEGRSGESVVLRWRLDTDDVEQLAVVHRPTGTGTDLYLSGDRLYDSVGREQTLPRPDRLTGDLLVRVTDISTADKVIVGEVMRSAKLPDVVKPVVWRC